MLPADRSSSLPGEPTTPPDYGSRDRRFREWFGWRPATGRRCPRTAVGRRCLTDSRCICQAHRDLLEHPAVWYDATGRRIFTAEPYAPVDAVELAAFVADAVKLGLYVGVSARSAWNPGKTVLLEVYDAARRPWRKRGRA